MIEALPAEARDMADLWNKLGHRIAPRYDTDLSWKDVGDMQERAHAMRFWMKKF